MNFGAFRSPHMVRLPHWLSIDNVGGAPCAATVDGPLFMAGSKELWKPL